MNKDLLHNKIVREILGRIYSGQYGLGRRLPAERTLCAELGVSRGTLREAMSNLANLGVVEIRHGSGAYVRQIRRDAIPSTFLPQDFKNVKLADIIAARKAIETAAAQFACERITVSQIKKLGTLMDQMKACIDNLPLFLKHDMEFHYGIVQSACNRPLEVAFEAIYEYHKYSMIFTSQHSGGEEAALDYHREMFEALKCRDSRRAAAAVCLHLDAMIDTVTSSRGKQRKTNK